MKKERGKKKEGGGGHELGSYKQVQVIWRLLDSLSSRASQT